MTPGKNGIPVRVLELEKSASSQPERFRLRSASL